VLDDAMEPMPWSAKQLCWAGKTRSPSVRDGRMDNIGPQNTRAGEEKRKIIVKPYRVCW